MCWGCGEFRTPDTCSSLVQAEAVTEETKKWAAWSVLSRQSPGCILKVVIYEFEGLKKNYHNLVGAHLNGASSLPLPCPLVMKAESSPSDADPFM